MTAACIKAWQLHGEHIGRIVQISIATDPSIGAKRAPIAGELTTISHDRGHAYITLRGIGPTLSNQIRGQYGEPQFSLEHLDDVVIDAFEPAESR